jgi:hypothetical protein
MLLLRNYMKKSMVHPWKEIDGWRVQMYRLIKTPGP